MTAKLPLIDGDLTGYNLVATTPYDNPLGDVINALYAQGGVRGAVTTGNATPTPIVSLAPASGSTTVYEATVAARKRGATSGASYKFAASYMNSSGAVSQLGSTTSYYTNESLPALNAAFAISGSNVLLNVTGEAPSALPSPILPVTPPTASTTWTVGTLGGENFPDLATALASASVLNGHRLLMSAQTFTTASTITVAKQVIIQGAGIGSTILQTAATGTDPVTVLEVTVSNVVVRDLTVKQRKTTNTSIEAAISINPAGGGAGATGHFLEAVRVETMEFGVVIRSDGWQINNCQLAYVGPNNSTRRLVGVYRSGGQGIFTNSTYDSGQDGIVTGNTRVFAVVTTTGLATEVLGGYLRIGNITPSNAYPVQQFFNCEWFQPSGTPLTMYVDGCTCSETSAFIVWTCADTQPPLSQSAMVVLKNNTMTNSHGKGAYGLNGSHVPVGTPGTTTFWAAGNTLGSTSFLAGWASGVSSPASPADAALIGYDTTKWSNPNQTLAVPSAGVWDWTATVVSQVAP